MKQQNKPSQTSQAIKIGMVNNARTRGKNSLSDQFHQFIVGKVIDWTLQERVSEGRFSAFKWGDAEKKLLNQIIENPQSADLDLPIQDSKFKRFFKSIAENGLNTLDVQMFYRYRDRLPLRQLNWEYKKEDFNQQNRKWGSKEIIHAGYYMLEVGLNTSVFSSQLQFDLLAKVNNKQIQTFELRARSNRICKRLIYLEQNSIIDIQAPEGIQNSNVYHFRLARLTRNFFLSRMLRKIGSHLKNKNHEKVTKHEFEVLWNRYDSTFQRIKNSHTEYDYYIKQVETKEVPSRAQQLRNLQLWKIKNSAANKRK